MKTPTFLTLAAITVLGAPSSSHAAGWPRLHGLGHDDVEASTPYRHNDSTGSSIVSSNRIGRANALVSHDPTEAANLDAGESEAVLSIGHQEVVHGFSFINESLEGKMSIQASTDRKTWIDLAEVKLASQTRFDRIEFAATQAKYFKLSFQLSSKGRLRNFELFGNDTDKDFDLVPAAAADESTEVNLADGIGGTRLIYIYPAPLKTTDTGTHHEYHQPFNFPDSHEKYRTVIYDLGEVRTLKSFGSVHSPRPVKFQVYLFDTLEEKKDWREQRTFDPVVFDHVKPAAVVEDLKGTGTVKVELDTGIPARYVALRWEPAYNPPPFSVDGVLIASRGWSLVPRTAGTIIPVTWLPRGYTSGELFSSPGFVNITDVVPPTTP